MSRRYLTLQEAELVLKRGKNIECFLGLCTRDQNLGVKWISLSKFGEMLRVQIFETSDAGCGDYLDIYSFGPLNQSLFIDQPDEEIIFNNFDDLIAEIEIRFPTSSTKFVNAGIVQDEYADYFFRGRK